MHIIFGPKVLSETLITDLDFSPAIGALNEGKAAYYINLIDFDKDVVRRRCLQAQAHDAPGRAREGL